MKSRELTPFGMEVKKALVDKRMTQTELAENVGVSPKYINLIIHGERSGEKYLPSIIALLDLDPKWSAKLIA